MMLLLLLIPIVYVGIAAVLYFVAKTWKGKTFVVLLFVLIPVADVIVGRIYFHQLCTKQAGQEIYRVVELEDKYLLKPGEFDKSMLNEKGDGYAIAKGGEIDKTKLEQRYQISLAKYDRNFSRVFHITRVSSSIRDRTTKEVYSTATTFLHYGGWVINNTGLHVSPRHCANVKRTAHSELLQRTLSSRAE